MNERELEQLLTARFRAEAGEAGSAPAALYASVEGIPSTIAHPAPWLAGRRNLILLTAAAMLPIAR